MASDLQWYDENDVPITEFVAFDEAEGGVPTAPIELRLYNDGPDPASNWWVQIVTRLDTEDPFVEEGIDLVDRHWVEVAILGGEGGATFPEGPYLPTGAGRPFELPTLETAQAVRLGVRIHLPQDTDTIAAVVGLVLRERRSVPVPLGLYRTRGNSINLGLGEWDQNEVLAFDGILENPGGADDQVQLGDDEVVIGGRYYTHYEEMVELNDEDAAAVALGMGESYKALFYWSSAGTRTYVKGLLGGSPADPDLPAGAKAIGVVTRGFDGIINTIDIDNQFVLAGAAFTSSALTAYVGRERSNVGDFLVTTTTKDPIELPPSTTSKIWRRFDGSLALGSVAPSSDAWADPRFEAVTDGSAVTSFRDLRRFGGDIVLLQFRFDVALAVGVYQRVWLPFRDCQLLPIIGATFSLDTVGAGSSGQTEIDVEYKAPGGAFASIFSDAARRFIFAFDATELRQRALPSTVQYQGSGEIRFIIDAVPSGGAAPAGGTGILYLAPTG